MTNEVKKSKSLDAKERLKKVVSGIQMQFSVDRWHIDC